MRRILFRWGGLTIWSYPAFLYLGMVVGLVAGNLAAHAAGIDAFATFVATIALMLLALVGARLLFVVTHWDVYRQMPSRIWDRGDGGAAMYGALPVVWLASAPLLAWLRVPYGRFWDVNAFTILVGMVFTRVGCLLNGCCAGRPSTRWGGVYLPNHLGVWTRRIPTQCLEAGWAVALIAGDLAVWDRAPFAGAVFLVTMGGYGVGRLILESMREREAGAGAFTMYHGCSLAMVLAAVGMLAVRWPR